MADTIKQPPIKGGRPTIREGRPSGIPQYQVGGPRSVGRLKTLCYDPIGELVANYRKLESEVERQEKIRDGKLVELTSTGKPRAYRAEIHHALYDKLINIGDKLLRYGYGRVPETINIENRRPSPLVINLTKKGDQYIVNDEQPDLIEYGDSEDGDLDER